MNIRRKHLKFLMVQNQFGVIIFSLISRLRHKKNEKLMPNVSHKVVHFEQLRAISNNTFWPHYIKAQSMNMIKTCS